ncbi:MAG TPA: TetR/AcrR family transcriptional regulator [Bryobacteraceae bacterium]|jgi:AcrR family transcriptional regulator|nr:TetR/AcrR family transcriptional regulator [Bryobacteraceae bacterium]
MPRTASSEAHRKVLDAAADLIADHGIDATSMDAIAARSGVSKATIYKHWADKEALVLEVMADLIGLRNRPDFNSGNTRADMEAVLSYRVEERNELRDRMTPHMMAYSVRNPNFGQAWRQMAMDPPRRELREAIARGIRKKELSAKLDIETSLALLLGPVLYWKIFLSKDEPCPKRVIQAAVSEFWTAYGIRRSSKIPKL